MKKKTRILIGVIALVVIIAAIVIIAVNSGKGKTENAEPDNAVTSATETDITKDASAVSSEDEAVPTIDPTSDSNLITTDPGPSTDTNLPTQEYIDQLVEEYEQEQAAKEAE